MAQEEPVERTPVTRCQHCPEIIELTPGTASWWRSKGRNGKHTLVCDPAYLDMRHKPMPRVPA